ncbi:MAG: hypothetical protein ACRENP_16105 [Longimicrobiales bacterium]
MKTPSPAQQLDAFIDRYSPEISAQARAALDRMRACLPGAIELVYDNYNGLVIGFGPNERASEAILSIVLYPRWVSLCFLQGAKLADPHKLLKGSGKVVRTITLTGRPTWRHLPCRTSSRGHCRMHPRRWIQPARAGL